VCGKYYLNIGPAKDFKMPAKDDNTTEEKE
jgi:hypothetical protein